MASQAPCVLALMAHPDDIEILCGGTLVRLREAGWRVVLATATHGDCGSAELDPEVIAAIRTREAEASAAMLGAEYLCLEQMDLFVLLNEESIRAAVEVMRRARPDVVITHSPADYMIDHEQASAIARTACFGAPIRNVATLAAEPAPVLDHIPHLYYADPLEGLDPLGNSITPGFWIDISDAMDRKEQLLACHASQREWLLKHHAWTSTASMREWGEARGRTSACATPRVPAAPRPCLSPDNLLGETLGALRP